MQTHQNDLKKSVKEIIPFFILFCIYIIIGSFGYGNDNDTYQMIRSGQELMSSCTYSPSRPPGPFIPDIFIGVSSFIGGSFLSNILSSIFSVLSLYLFWFIIKKYYENFNAILIVAIIGLNPHFIIASSSSIDYIYSIFFSISGIALFLSNRLILASFFFGCAVASRLGNCLIIALVYLYFVAATAKSGDRRKLIRVLLSIGISICVTACLYIPVYKAYNNTFYFFTYYIEDWTYFEHLARLIYKNIYLFGLPAFILLLSHVVVRIVRKDLFFSLEILFALAIILAHELLFLKIPLEISYLLPLLFVIVPLWIFVCKPKRTFTYGLLATTIIYAFFVKFDILDIHYNEAGNVAIAADVGLHLRTGLIVNDIQHRSESEELFFREYNLSTEH